jgi:PHD/YefM family antitoxin component YafN of YafNO toxin-antitoxin module
MLSYTASHAKQNFAAMIDSAARQPVVIRRQKREVAMVISPDEYRRFNRLNVDEFLSFCDAAGRVAAQNGMTESVLAELLAEEGQGGVNR